MSSSSSSCWSQQLINMPVIYKRVVIGFFFFFFVFFLLLTRDQSGNGSMETVTTATATALQLQQQLQPSGQNEANQIEHVPSQSSPEHLSGNFSSIFNSSYSVDKAYTLTSTSTPTPSPQALPIISSAVSTSISTSSSVDAQQLIDLHNFAYLMEQPACEAHIVILILVHTAPGNRKKRSLIRQTWGMPQMTQGNSPLRLVFLLGAVQPHADIQHQLEEENARYMDMVQGNFHDAYRNMTYKHVMALKWFNQYCPHAQFLIKADDDVFVNTPQLLKLLGDPVANLLQPHQHELLLCRPEMKSAVKRTYRVSMQGIRNALYPLTCFLSLSVAVQVACQLQGVPRTLLSTLLPWLWDYLLRGCGETFVSGSTAQRLFLD